VVNVFIDMACMEGIEGLHAGEVIKPARTHEHGSIDPGSDRRACIGIRPIKQWEHLPGIWYGENSLPERVFRPRVQESDASA
jgi:hypothetical protein